MKTTLNLLLFLCTTLPLHAQHTEWNIQPQQYTEINAVKYNGNNKWFIGGIKESIHNDASYLLYRVDTLNEIHNQANANGVEKLNSFFGDSILIYSYGEQGSNKFIHRLGAFNSGTTIYFVHELDTNEVVKKIVRLANNDMVILGYRLVNSEKWAMLKILSPSIISSGSNVSYEDIFTKGYYNNMLVINDSTFMATGSIESNGNKFGARKYNQYYEVIEELLPNMESDHFIPSGDGGFFMVKNETVTKLNQNMEVMFSENFGSYGEWIDLEVDEENIFFLFQKTDEAPWILKIDNDLQIVDSFSIEDEFFTAKDMSLSEEEIGVGGILNPNMPFNETPFTYTSTSGFFKTYSKDGIYNTKTVDLEILDVKIKDHEIIPECNGIDINPTYTLNLKNIEVTFINHGTEKVVNASIFLQALGIDECDNPTPNPAYHFHHEELKLLRIESGDTLNFRIPAYEFSQAITDTTSIQLCIWNTEVDNKRDQDPSNSYFCAELDLQKLIFEEPPVVKPTEEEFLIFPNPIRNSMTVSLKQYPFDPTSIQFYDQLGRISNGYVIAARAGYKVFDTSDLASGFYFVRIKNDLIDEVVRVYVFP